VLTAIVKLILKEIQSLFLKQFKTMAKIHEEIKFTEVIKDSHITKGNTGYFCTECLKRCKIVCTLNSMFVCCMKCKAIIELEYT
jgi:hypothetical protein